MADCIGFQAQIASIIEILANSAVAEICKLVDDGYAALRSQMEQEREKSAKENDALRRKLRDMDVKMRSYERKMRRRCQREEMHAGHFRPPEGKQMGWGGRGGGGMKTCMTPTALTAHASSADHREEPDISLSGCQCVCGLHKVLQLRTPLFSQRLLHQCALVKQSHRSTGYVSRLCIIRQLFSVTRAPKWGAGGVLLSQTGGTDPMMSDWVSVRPSDEACAQ